MTLKHINYRYRRLAIFLLAPLFLVTTAGAFAGGKQEKEPPKQLSQPAQTQPRDQGERIELGPEKDDQGKQGVAPEEVESKPAWIMGQYEFDDTLEETVSDTIEKGYVPVGLDMLGGTVTILYLLTDELEFTRWTIQKVEDARKMNDTVTAWIADGWMPLDIALIPGGVSFLLIETDHDIDSWRMEVIPATPEALEATYGQYQADGYIPYGLASDPQREQFWILFLRAEGVFDIPEIVIDAFMNDSVADGINNRLTSGALPWAMTRLPDRFFVQFIQP